MDPLIGGLATGVINGAMNIFGSALNNSLAAEREETARQKNYQLNELAAENADRRTRALYNDLQSPKALLEQYKEAGLSPSLMFGGSGAGGSVTQAAQGAGVAGINPKIFGVSPIDAAQINALNAQARKANAEADTESGINERGAAQIKNLIADTNNKTLKAVYQEYENSLAEIETTVEASLQETKIKNYVTQTEYLMHITRSAKVKGDIDEKTEQEIINYLHERTLNVAADTLLKKSQKRLNESNIAINAKQCENLISQINTRTKQLEINENTLKEQVKQWAIENGFTETKTNAELANIIWDNWNDTAGNIIKALSLLKK